MFELLGPTRIDPKDTFLREITSRVARGQKLDPKPSLPEGFPSISVIMIVKNEWQTLASAVASVQPFASELIIGVDRNTDSPISFAYQLAFEKMPLDKCVPFFDKIMAGERYATFAEIAQFIDMGALDLERLCDERSAKLPTWSEANRCLKAIGVGEVFWLDFKDHFSEARNETIKRATGDYMMMIDGHEYFRNPEVFIDGFANVLKYHGEFFRLAVTLDEIDSPHRQTIAQDRLFKRTPGAHYERGVHNMLKIPEEDIERFRPPYIQDLVLVHDRPQWLAHFREPQRHKMTKMHMGAENDLSSLYYAGISAHRRGDFEVAKKKYQEYLDGNKKGPEAAYIAMMMARAFFQEGDPENALEWALMGGMMCPAAAYCWHFAAVVLLKTEESLEDEYDQRKTVMEALDLLRLAASCEVPNSTQAVPTSAYGWETFLAMSDAYCRLGDNEKAVECMQRAIQSGCPPDAAMAIYRLIAMGQQASLAELEAKISADRTGKTLYICDKMMQFTRDVAEIAQSAGYQIVFSQEFDPKKALFADVIWCDWADENAVAATHFPLGDRKLIVRCHSYETYTPMPREIRWEAVTVPLCSCEHAAKRIEDKFGIYLDWRFLTVVPNPEQFPLLKKFESTDVLFLGRFNSKKGVENIPELAALLPTRIVRVGGTLQDERLYEGLIDRCLRTGLGNIALYGHLDACETNDFLSMGKFYVSFSPWETYSVAMMEAMCRGIYCYALDFEWTDWYEDQITRCPSVYDMARMIQSQTNEIPRAESREWVARKYEGMRNTIKEILDCPTDTTPKPSLLSPPSVCAGKIPVLKPSDGG